jgi:hypothetical protein
MADERISDFSIGRYQVDRMAGWNGENCLLELLPLASNSPADTKVYAANSQLHWLKKNGALMAEYGWRRAQRLKEMIDEHHPKVVVFYSYSQKKHDDFQQFWQLVARADFAETTLPFTSCATRNGSYYFVIPHPIRAPYLKLSPSAYFSSVGRFITARLRETTPPAGPTLRKRGASVFMTKDLCSVIRRSLYRRPARSSAPQSRPHRTLQEASAPGPMSAKGRLRSISPLNASGPDSGRVASRFNRCAPWFHQPRQPGPRPPDRRQHERRQLGGGPRGRARASARRAAALGAAG